MFDLLKQKRMQMLGEQIIRLKDEAKRLMRTGDITNYLRKITEADKLKNEYDMIYCVQCN